MAHCSSCEETTPTHTSKSATGCCSLKQAQSLKFMHLSLLVISCRPAERVLGANLLARDDHCVILVPGRAWRPVSDHLRKHHELIRLPPSLALSVQLPHNLYSVCLHCSIVICIQYSSAGLDRLRCQGYCLRIQHSFSCPARSRPRPPHHVFYITEHGLCSRRQPELSTRSAHHGRTTEVELHDSPS